jgi:hypothetical protein
VPIFGKFAIRYDFKTLAVYDEIWTARSWGASPNICQVASEVVNILTGALQREGSKIRSRPPPAADLVKILTLHLNGFG